VRAVLARAALAELAFDAVSTRSEAGVAVPGLLVVARR
jgi:predicted TPR repeat methyltransferase